jgi:hypothetical protein
MRNVRLARHVWSAGRTTATGEKAVPSSDLHSVVIRQTSPKLLGRPRGSRMFPDHDASPVLGVS